MATVTATWNGYLGRAADGTILVPGAQVEVEQAVAESNPHYTVTQTATPEPVVVAPDPVVLADPAAQTGAA